MIPTYAWVLPRPRPDRYPGGFPLHFEKKLWRLLDCPEPILHPFGGLAELGVRVDRRVTHPIARPDVIWTPPEIRGDAAQLPFRDGVFGLVICDPPYSQDDAGRLYRLGRPPSYTSYIAEAVRVTRPGGFVASYHVTMTPRPEGTVYFCRILLGTRVWHRLRACCVFQRTS